MEIAFPYIMSVTIMMIVETILMKWAAVSNNISKIKNYNAVEIEFSETESNECFFLNSILSIGFLISLCEFPYFLNKPVLGLFS